MAKHTHKTLSARAWCATCRPEGMTVAAFRALLMGAAQTPGQQPSTLARKRPEGPFQRQERTLSDHPWEDILTATELNQWDMYGPPPRISDYLNHGIDPTANERRT